jgi:phage FluMu protein gp41
MPLQTEFEFLLPRGYVDETGTLHRKGVMRLATAADEVLPMKDHRVQTNAAYLSVILMSRVIKSLGDLGSITPKVIENLFASDLAYLQELYRRVNENGSGHIEATCPRCEQSFEVDPVPLAEAS